MSHRGRSHLDVVTRLRLMQGAFALLFLVLGAQVLRMQVLDPRLPPALTDGAMPQVQQTEPARGLILDRHGAVLARNVPEFRVAIVPGELPEDERERRRVLAHLEALLGVSYARLEAATTNHLARVDPHLPQTVQTGLDAERAITLRAALAGKPYARVDSFASRVYESTGALAHIVGHVGAIPPGELDRWVDEGYPHNGRIGLTGVEARYEPELRGHPGARFVLQDPTGRVLDVLAEQQPDPGGNLVLSIDLELQRATEAALARGIEAGLATVRRGAPGRPPLSRSGAAVVMDVRTGELLALVSLPTYDANLFTGKPDEAELARIFADPARPLIDRTYMWDGRPGSTFKTLVAFAALEEGIARPETRITSTGAFRIEQEGGGAYIIRDWAAHGTVDMYNAMARSSNVYFFWLAGGYREGGRQVFEGLGVWRLAEWTSAFGFGRPTGVDLPGETPGLVPDPDWKEQELGEEWFLGETYTFGIGQSHLRVTPLQMTVMTAAIANGGELLAPRVVRGVERDGRIDLLPRTVTGIVPGDAAHFDVVRRTMHTAAHAGNGTGRTAVVPGVTMGGKTGTAEFGVPYPDGSYDTHGWYIAFAPYDDPEIAITVFLEHGVGATHAGPVVREILEAYFAAPDEADETGDGAAAPAGDRAARP